MGIDPDRVLVRLDEEAARGELGLDPVVARRVLGVLAIVDPSKVGALEEPEQGGEFAPAARTGPVRDGADFQVGGPLQAFDQEKLRERSGHLSECI